MGKSYRADWLKISPWMVAQAQTLTGCLLDCLETRVYLSYNPRVAEDRRLKDWALNTLDKFPGVRVIATERKLKYAPYCPVCHNQVQNCPHCGKSMVGTVEKGVDTAIVTDMFSLAWENSWDVAILLSSDRDFIPAVEMFNRKGLRVINAHFPPAGAELARLCWASIDLRAALKDVSR